MALQSTALNGAGTAAAPTGGSAFVSITNVPTGTYRVKGWYGISGAAETAAKNIRLSLATGGSVMDLPSGMGTTTLIPFEIEGVHVNTPNDTLRMTAIAGATAATVYTGTLTMTRTGP